MKCRVLIADDVEAIRYLWRLQLETHRQVEIVGEAADGQAAITGVEHTKPDVLLLDLSMPGKDGLEVIKAISRSTPETAIVVASGFAASRMARTAMDLGAVAYFEKGDSPEHLIRVVLAACEHASRTRLG